MQIDKKEVLRYLGYKGGEVDREIYDLIEGCSNEILSVAVPRTVYNVFEIDEKYSLSGSIFRLQGNDIKKHLQGCRRCVLMAATIGIEVENAIRKAQITDMARAVVLDSCATAAVESLCDEVQDKISAEYKYITSRYSPGYGDMPVEMQKEFALLLDTPRKIGLTVTEADILLPRKSVTAVIGISDTEIPKIKRNCDSCSLKETCSFKREGKSCDG